MVTKMLYSDENSNVRRHSSLDQYRGFLAVAKKGGWAPIVFEQLDGITCETLHTHPVILSFGSDLGYHFPEASCSYLSEKFVHFDKRTVEQALLPECMGGTGEFYEYFVDANAFINFDNATSVGTKDVVKLRVGLDYVRADEILPSSDIDSDSSSST